MNLVIKSNIHFEFINVQIKYFIPHNDMNSFEFCNDKTLEPGDLYFFNFILYLRNDVDYITIYVKMIFFKFKTLLKTLLRLF